MKSEKINLSAHAKRVIFERNIKHKWIEDTINNPDKREPDSTDTSIEHRLKIIEEYGSRVLRVICKKNIEPTLVITTFFDRREKGKLK
ncbi:hypothetical protein BMS3Abin03_00195 [bacterium BMS3Abin03]|nr:hypothetical protein BMS3Abin03_00195 [bacterium BMS3Abin03]